MANLSQIVKKLTKERIRLHKTVVRLDWFSIHTYWKGTECSLDLMVSHSAF